jgi:nicotinamide-nucleotide amidase
MVREGYRKTTLIGGSWVADATVAGRGWVSLAPMASDPELYELAARVGHKLHAAERRIVTAESCTAGWVAKALTDVPGSSQWFECGYVPYSDAAKVRDLGVAAHTLESFGAVSEQTVREMAEGALRVSGANVALAVSGIAGPDGGTPGKPVGTVWFCAAARQARATDIIAEEKLFGGDRAFVRSRSVQHALRLILRLDLPVRLEATPRTDAV